jgi:hypothetical protein
MSLIYSNKDIPYQNPEDINETEIKTDFLRQSKIRRGERFLKGPIPLRDIAAAALLPGKSLALFLVVHHQITLTGKPIITRLGSSAAAEIRKKTGWQRQTL